MALTAGFALLGLAVLAAFAQFGVLQTLVVPADASATVANILASEGLFRAAITAFLVVILLDVVVAWALYVLLRPVNETLALLVGWLRVAYAAVFAFALANLLDVAQLLGTSGQAITVQPLQRDALVMASVASFNNAWTVSLAIFGLHLLGLGVLLFVSGRSPKVLGVLVAVAGVGYLFDSFGKILVADYALTISVFTFLGEAFLIVWLFWIGIRGMRPDPAESIPGDQASSRVAGTVVASSPSAP